MVVVLEERLYLKHLEDVQQKKINNCRMYFSLRFLKKLNFGKKRQLMLHNRSQNVPSYSLKKAVIYISRGLYPTKYLIRLKIKPSILKYGMFSFTRKPFAIPEKKTRKKR